MADESQMSDEEKYQAAQRKLAKVPADDAPKGPPIDPAKAKEFVKGYKSA